MDLKVKVAVIFGTRPEAIKLAPVIRELKSRSDQFEVRVIGTAQHREMLDQVLDLFGIELDYDLNVMRPDQSLFQVTTQVLQGLETLLSSEKPSVVIVQGDTTTTFVASLAAFYLQIMIGHVEAGLRTFDKRNPFPEEVNRHLTSVLADYHFAPTERARRNLLREGIGADSVFLTGNTVIDALLYIVEDGYSFAWHPQLREIDFENKRVIAITAHRRESFGRPMRDVFLALRDVVSRNGDVEIVFPVHLNPNVHRMAHEVLGGVDRIHLIEPLSYSPFVQLMNKSYLILTDSGGIQEEAPSLGKPVLVLRQVTERPEAIEAGTARLVGTDRELIVQTVQKLLDDRQEYDKMARTANPFGDGRAALRVVDILLDAVIS
jgi:UDP-N-acetylglucosamine 2-epimerase (non-hydrolysing)